MLNTKDEYYFCPKCGNLIKRDWSIKEIVSVIDLEDGKATRSKDTIIDFEYVDPNVYCKTCNELCMPTKTKAHAIFVATLIHNYGIRIFQYHDNTTCEYLSNIYNDIRFFFPNNIIPPTNNFILIASNHLPQLVEKITSLPEPMSLKSKFLYSPANSDGKPIMPRILLYLDSGIDLEEDLKLSEMENRKTEYFKQDLEEILLKLSK